jgi:hypothetical protein
LSTVKTGAEKVMEALVYVPAGNEIELRKAESLCSRVKSTGYTVGLSVTETAEPLDGSNVMPVIPTVAESTETFVNERAGLLFMVTARLAF